MASSPPMRATQSSTSPLASPPRRIIRPTAGMGGAITRNLRTHTVPVALARTRDVNGYAIGKFNRNTEVDADLPNGVTEVLERVGRIASSITYNSVATSACHYFVQACLPFACC